MNKLPYCLIHHMVNGRYNFIEANGNWSFTIYHPDPELFLCIGNGDNDDSFYYQVERGIGFQFDVLEEEENITADALALVVRRFLESP